MSSQNVPRVLVAEDSPTQAQHIQFLLEDGGFVVETASDGKDALRILGERIPDIITTDLEMPEMNGLELVEAVRNQYPAVPVVLITAHGSEEIAALALRKGASSYVPKAQIAEDLVDTLKNILAVTQADRHQQRALECMVSSETLFVIGNDASLIPPLIGYLDSLLSRTRFCDANARMRVCVALNEALMNAIQHGNLEVSSELRQVDENVFRDMVRKRSQEPPYCDRRVYCRVSMTVDEAVYAIRDSGPGFDPTGLPDPYDPANLERVGGRGLLLIRTFMDRVTHNDTGNEITLIKHRSR